jgi:hypothetical protein
MYSAAHGLYERDVRNARESGGIAMTMIRSGGSTSRSLFGDLSLLIFLLAQASDGVLTYVGVNVYGPQMEGNPLIGQGPALAGAKLTAGIFGVALHMSAVHKAVALLALFYVVVAICPWVALLFLFPVA